MVDIALRKGLSKSVNCASTDGDTSPSFFKIACFFLINDRIRPITKCEIGRYNDSLSIGITNEIACIFGKIYKKEEKTIIYK